MKLARKYKIKINKEAKNYLDFASEQCRLLYNFSLAEQIEYYKNNKKSLSIYKQRRNLVDLKQKFPNYSKVYNKCLSIMLFRLDNAYKNFFRRMKNPKEHNKGFPKFIKKGKFVSQEYPKMYIVKINDNMFYIPTGYRKRFIARIREKLPEKYGNMIIKKEKDNYFACFYTDIKEEEFIDNKEILAFDLGIKNLASGYSSKNEFVKVPKFSHYTKHLDRLRSKRDLKKKGSIKWNKTNQTFQKRLEKYKNRVNDYLHKASNWLCSKRSESIIVVGKLNLKNMKTEKSWFNRILMNEWRVGKFVEMLNYKTKKYGKCLEKTNESYTTQTCCVCGNKKSMDLSEREYNCSCGNKIDRDYNSAINIYKKYCAAGAVSNKETRFGFDPNNLNVDTFVYI